MWPSANWFFLFLVFSCVFADRPPCTDVDLIGIYTRCTSLNDTRVLFYYYDAQCDATGLPIPAPVGDLPCDISCPAGSYLPLASNTCETCQPGTYSMGGGDRFYQWKGSFPRTSSLLFRTYCSNTDSIAPSPDFDNCGWQLNGIDTNSGNLTGMSSVNSILELSLALLESGTVGFKYMCDVERTGDIFAYKVDDLKPVELLPTSQYMYTTIPLSAGLHKIRWIFYKNPQESNGEDVARISLVEVYGLKAATDIECPKCPVGGYQPESGQAVCLKCPINTAASVEGTVECEACVNGFSPQGSSECLPFTRSCTTQDTVQIHGACEQDPVSKKWENKVSYGWQTPLMCDNSGVALPEDLAGVACVPCPSGTHVSNIVGNEFTCEPCPSGYFSSGAEECAPCSEGSAAVGTEKILAWDTWPTGLTTICYGHCLASGWVLAHDHIEASLHASFAMELLLSVQLNVGYGGGFEIDWEIVGLLASSSFEITIDGEVVSQFNSGKATSQFDLSMGKHTVSFRAHGTGEADAEIRISRLIISGTGGASECTTCPAGFYQSQKGQAICVACPAGQFSSHEGSVACKKCSKDSFSSRPGQTTCTACSGGTHSSSGSTYCENGSCSFQTENGKVTYNLSPYAGFPQHVDNEETSHGAFLVSYCGALTDTQCPDSSYICEVYEKFNPYNPTSTALSWATRVEFEESLHPKEGFSLHFYDGESIGCPDNQTRSAVVDFTCETNPEHFTSLELSASQSTTCKSVFKQTSVYGCPLCSASDFNRKEGECKNGEMTVQYVKAKSSKCNGIIKDTKESCGDVSLNLPLAIVLLVLVVVIFVVLIAAVTLIFCKNRRLKVEYMKLKNNNTEMDEVEDLGAMEDALE